jgi:phosphoribosylformylglycinamidine synthase I
MMPVKALILTGYGLNCDYETDYALKLAGTETLKMHINDVIEDSGNILKHCQILVFGGGFSWADDHGAGVILASKIRFNIGEMVNEFIDEGNLVIGICNGFQSLVNLGLLPGFNNNYMERRVALTNNDRGNFIDCWVNLKVNPGSNCVFTKGMKTVELPVRHAEGKFFASEKDIDRLFNSDQVAMQYADREGNPAGGAWPFNPNGSAGDIAGICDPTGRIFGLMPHPEAFHSYMNHPDWTSKRERLSREGKSLEKKEGDGIKIFRNAVEYAERKLS